MTLRLTMLSSTKIDMGNGKTISGLDLVDSWSARVLRLFHEANDPHSMSMSSCWGVHDFIAALFIRDHLDNGIHHVNHEGEADPFAVQVADELFQSFTVLDAKGRLRTARSDLSHEPWWWQRIPSRGPIRDELWAIASGGLRDHQ